MFYLLTVITMFATLSIFTLYGYKYGINFPNGDIMVKKRNSISKEEAGTTLFVILMASLIPIFGFSFLFGLVIMHVCYFLYVKIITIGGNAIGTRISNFINEKVLKNGK